MSTLISSQPTIILTAIHVKRNMVDASVVFAPIVEEAANGIEQEEEEQEENKELFEADMSVRLDTFAICEAAVEALLHSPSLHRLNYSLTTQPLRNTWLEKPLKTPLRQNLWVEPSKYFGYVSSLCLSNFEPFEFFVVRGGGDKVVNIFVYSRISGPPPHPPYRLVHT